MGLYGLTLIGVMGCRLQVLAALREETAGIHGGHMQVAPEQGQFMAVLVKLLGVKSAIEVGLPGVVM
jgi:predicted O-methyltransferase YrrM